MPAGAITALAAMDDVLFVSPDREVHSLGHITATTGADLVRSGSGVSGSELDGSGVGIAVLDSGLYLNHVAFLDRSGKQRVVVNRSFFNVGDTGDPYGHGSHVTSIAAGNGQVAGASYMGIAPNASIYNLRVLDQLGNGVASSVLSAFDWLMANHAALNIRVVNLSFGMPAVDSYKDDAVCLGVRKLVDAGLVVVVAAGNGGKDSAGTKCMEQSSRPLTNPLL